MLLFGHVGITAAAARICDTVCSSGKPYGKPSGFRCRISKILNRFRDDTGAIDYRMLVFGSMLPDIIDKPVFLLLRDRGYILSGRDSAHTLLFHLLLLAAGLALLKRKKSWMLVIAAGSYTHLVLDFIWEMPGTLFWPFFGGFSAGDPSDFYFGVWLKLVSEPEIYIPEIAGLAILLYFAFRIVWNRGAIRMIKTGRM